MAVVREVVAPVSAAVVRDECVAGYGMDLVAYLLGAGLREPLRSWRFGTAARTPSGMVRLRAAHTVLAQFKDPEHARAWLRRPNPDLGGRPPAEVLRTARGGRDALAVIEAAELPTGRAADRLSCRPAELPTR